MPYRKQRNGQWAALASAADSAHFSISCMAYCPVTLYVIHDPEQEDCSRVWSEYLSILLRGSQHIVPRHQTDINLSSQGNPLSLKKIFYSTTRHEASSSLRLLLGTFYRRRSRKVNMCLCRIGEVVTVVVTVSKKNWGGGYGV